MKNLDDYECYSLKGNKGESNLRFLSLVDHTSDSQELILTIISKLETQVKSSERVI